jgi:hypothetical protein
MRSLICTVVLAGLSSLPASALAQSAEGDVFLELVGGDLRVGLISEDGSTITPNQRVFFAEFGADFPNVAAEPGVQSVPGGLGSATSFRFDIRRALRKWNGADFSLIANETMTADLGPLSVTSPISDVLTAGFSINLDPSGSHEHPDWTLNAPASNGVYLLDVQWSLSTGETSQPTWLIFAQDATPSEADAAVAWALTNIPTPASASMLVVGSMLAVRRRRK